MKESRMFVENIIHDLSKHIITAFSFMLFFFFKLY